MTRSLLLQILPQQRQSKPRTQTPTWETPAPLTLLNLTEQSKMKEASMTTLRRFKFVPTFCGSLSIHVFMLLFRLIADSSVFTSDVIRERKTTIEIGRPFEEMCDNFPLFII